MKSNARKILQLLRKENPNPTTELVYSSNFELLISVVLSAQATDISVNKATKNLFVSHHTAEAIYALGEEGLKAYIKTIGLYNSKARNIINLCKILIEQHSSQVPNTRAALEKLPGVGRKTANVVLNTAFGQPTIAVDTHIFRVANRLGITKGKTPLAVEHQLLACIPEEFALNAHHWLILHGRYICKARTPLCAKCELKEYCEYYASIAK